MGSDDIPHLRAKTVLDILSSNTLDNIQGAGVDERRDKSQFAIYDAEPIIADRADRRVFHQPANLVYPDVRVRRHIYIKEYTKNDHLSNRKAK